METDKLCKDCPESCTAHSGHEAKLDRLMVADEVAGQNMVNVDNALKSKVSFKIYSLTIIILLAVFTGMLGIMFDTHQEINSMYIILNANRSEYNNHIHELKATIKDTNTLINTHITASKRYRIDAGRMYESEHPKAILPELPEAYSEPEEDCRTFIELEPVNGDVD